MQLIDGPQVVGAAPVKALPHPLLINRFQQCQRVADRARGGEGVHSLRDVYPKDNAPGAHQGVNVIGANRWLNLMARPSSQGRRISDCAPKVASRRTAARFAPMTLTP